jgi:hypothetical protein
LLFLLLPLLVLCACSGKGLDHVITLKEIDQLENIAAEMEPEAALIFGQAVIADVRQLTVQLGFSAMAEGLSNYGDPSRDPKTGQTEEIIGKLQAMDGKTARVVTIEKLQEFKAKLLAESERRSAASVHSAIGNQTDQSELDTRIATLDRKIEFISKAK